MAPAILPGHPFDSVSRVAESITASKLLAVPVSVTTLGTNQSQEVEFVQVDLKETDTHRNCCNVKRSRANLCN